jgi:hypothetical protein
VPEGYVVVESGRKILCGIYLYQGEGSCSPTARALAPGPDEIVADYSGDRSFEPSTSSMEALTVLGQ